MGDRAICGANSHASEMFGWMIIGSGIYDGGIEANSGTYGQCSGGSLCTAARGCPTCDHSTGFDWLDVREDARRAVIVEVLVTAEIMRLHVTLPSVW